MWAYSAFVLVVLKKRMLVFLSDENEKAMLKISEDQADVVLLRAKLVVLEVA